MLFAGALCALWLPGQSLQPTVVGSAGAFGAHASASLSWTTGESQTETYSGSSAMLTQGFHQPAYVITAIESAVPDVSVQLYPNPATEFVHLKLTQGASDTYTAVLVDIHGRILRHHRLEGPAGSLKIDLHSLADATYFLRLSGPSNFLQTFRLQKTN